MTTVLLTPDICAADTRRSQGDIAFGQACKLELVTHKRRRYVVAFHGDTTYSTRYIAYLRGKGDCPDVQQYDRDTEYGAIMGGALDIEARKLLWIAADGKFVPNWCSYLALGSGGQLAIAAYLASRDVEKSVRIASELDNGSGPPVTVWMSGRDF